MAAQLFWAACLLLLLPACPPGQAARKKQWDGMEWPQTPSTKFTTSNYVGEGYMGVGFLSTCPGGEKRTSYPISRLLFRPDFYVRYIGYLK
jgi:hypothetical protein